MTPVLPFVTDNEDNIRKIVKKASDSNANFIYTKMGMTLRSNVHDYYYKNIDKLYVGLSNDYKTVYGNNVVCNPLKYPDLLEFFVKECNKYHLLCDMGEIIKDYKRKVKLNEQISLF